MQCRDMCIELFISFVKLHKVDFKTKFYFMALKIYAFNIQS